MIEIGDGRGNTLRGKSPESIARRVHGRRAIVKYQGEQSTPGVRFADILLPPPTGADAGHGYAVLATWVIPAECIERHDPYEDPPEDYARGWAGTGR